MMRNWRWLMEGEKNMHFCLSWVSYYYIQVNLVLMEMYNFVHL